MSNIPKKNTKINPSGYNDDGSPFWIINGQKVGWEQMQQLLWLQSQVTEQSKPSSGGPEQINIPSFPELPDYESKDILEASIEKPSVRETNNTKKQVKVEKPAAVAVSTTTKPTTKLVNSLVGDSQELKIDLTDLKQMQDFIDKNVANSGNEDSSKYLAVLLNKLMDNMRKK